jgi:hypothetical protein
MAAHLTLAGLPRRRLYAWFLRYPGGANRTIRDGSKALARALSNGRIRENLGAMIGLHRPVPGPTCREALIVALGHTLDMAIPLGRQVPVSPKVVADAADRVLSYRGTRNARVFRELPIGGLRLQATDHDWSTGAGPEVSGTMTDLFLVLTGRTVHWTDWRAPAPSCCGGAWPSRPEACDPGAARSQHRGPRGGDVGGRRLRRGSV